MIPDERTVIIIEQSLTFRSFRKMYLKLRAEDRGRVQYVLQLLANDMRVKLREYSDWRKQVKNLDKNG